MILYRGHFDVHICIDIVLYILFFFSSFVAATLSALVRFHSFLDASIEFAAFYPS